MTELSEQGPGGAVGLEKLAGRLAHVFLEPGSTFSLASLGCALVIAALFLVLRRKRKTPLRLKALLRALLPSWMLTHKSSRADLMFFVLNVFVTGLLVGWALLSAGVVREAVANGLDNLFGERGASGLPMWASVAIVTVVTFVAYDFAYWFDHYIKHKIPAMWAFHSVHHTAEVLTPLTTYRMHPIDSLIFFNLSAAIIGSAHGVAVHFLDDIPAATLSGMNIILVFFIFTLVHLQHSHIRLGWSGLAGKLFFSPRHHHLHHSDDPEHFGKNLGSCLAVWDWIFGTLYLPEKASRLKFGADVGTDEPHSLRGSLLHPFAMAARELSPARPVEALTPPSA